MCIRGFVVLFFGLVFLLPVASLPSRDHHQATRRLPALLSFLPPFKMHHLNNRRSAVLRLHRPPASVPLLTTAKRVCTQVKSQVKNIPLSLGLNGNAGIGTTVPYTKLDVTDSTAISSFTGVNNQGVRIGGGGTGDYSLLQFKGDKAFPIAQIGALQNNATGTTLVFGTSNNYNGAGITNSALAIDPDGNVGIGTVTPAAPLNVFTSRMGAPSLTSSANVTVEFSSGITTALDIGNDSASPYEVWLQTKRYNNDGTNWPLAINPLGGNVGMVTADPDFRDVHASIAVG